MSVERELEQILDAEKQRRVSQIRVVQPLSPCLGVCVSASRAFVCSLIALLASQRQERVRQASSRAPRDQCGVSNDGTTRCVMMSKIRCHCAMVAVAASPVVRAADVTTRRLAGTTMMNCPPQPFARVKAWPAT
jgi:hypothetical protein